MTEYAVDTTVPQPASQDGSAKLALPFVFLGTTGQYFRIYTVNVMLSILTLGIYSAWAKIRNQRFFYGFTELHGERFDYDARPLTILISRIAILILLILTAQIDINYELLWNEIGLFSTLLLLLLPFAIVRGRAFNARYTLFMGIRFHYQRIYWPSYRIFFLFSVPALGLPILISVLLQLREQSDGSEWSFAVPWLLGLWFAHLLFLMPLWDLMRHKVKINQLSYGRLPLRFTATTRQYYLAYLKTLPLLALGIVSFFALTFSDPANFFIYLPLLIIVVLLWFLSYRAILARVFWDSIALDDGSRLQCNLRPMVYLFKIVILNIILVIFSLGVLIPWARVRKWRYIAHSICLLPNAELRTVIDQRDMFKEALGAEFVDVEGSFDLDFGLI